MAGLSERELIDLKERIVIATAPLELPYPRVAFTPAERDWLVDAVNLKARADAVPELASPDGHEPNRIDAGNTMGIAHEFLRIIRRHYHAHKLSRDRVLEILNALAFTVEAVLHATNHDKKAVDFFEQARSMNRATGD